MMAHHQQQTDDNAAMPDTGSTETALPKDALQSYILGKTIKKTEYNETAESSNT